MSYAKRLITYSAGLAALSASLLGGSLPAQAQTPNGQSVAKGLLGFVSTGGYFITGSARHAIGSTKFYNQGAFYARPKNLGPLSVTGGIEIVGASDHFFPFTGGDYYNLVGPGFRVSTAQNYHGITPFISGGAFYGELRSVQLGFDKSAFTPSLSVGADWKFSQNLSLSASYRISQKINGFSTDGFGVFLKLF